MFPSASGNIISLRRAKRVFHKTSLNDYITPSKNTGFGKFDTGLTVNNKIAIIRIKTHQRQLFLEITFTLSIYKG